MTFPPACTIVSNNYLALARVFADSYRMHHPGAEVFVCVADRPSAEIDYRALPFRTIFAEELGVPAFMNLAFRYELIELCTAMKPFLFAHLRDRHAVDRAFYFDPDILILARLDELIDSLTHHSAVLTPHITEGLPDDGLRPSERLILLSGIYNLGFLGLNLDESTESFLRWWGDRVYRFCVQDIHNGLFFDQRWMDLAPAFLPSVEIQRSPAYNIAYWNLGQRRIQREPEGWTVNGRPAGFFHFSGIVLDHLGAISKYQNRINSSTNPEVMPLLEDYRALVLEAGHEKFSTVPYGFGTFLRSGLPISPVFRRALRRVDPLGLRWNDPFNDVPEGFSAWLAEPLEFHEGSLNRAVISLWESRPDLMHTFPAVWGTDLKPFVERLGGSTLEARDGIHDEFLPTQRSGSVGRAFERLRAKRTILPLENRLHVNSGLETIDLTDPGPAAAWLNEHIPARKRWPRLSRLSLRLHETRRDVQEVFPDPLGADQESFARWFVLSAGNEYGLAESLVQPIIRSFPFRERLTLRLQRMRSRKARPQSVVRPSIDTRPHEIRPIVGRRTTPGRSSESFASFELEPGRMSEVHGVNLAGYFTSPTGVGQVARGTALALEHAGLPMARVPLDADWWSRVRDGAVDQPEGAPFDITIMHVNADETPNALQLLPPSAVASSFMIGCWYWELSHFPLQFADRFDYLDEVWAPSRFCQTSFEALASVPVMYVPPFVPPPRSAAPDRLALGLELSRFYFLLTFDVFSIAERKNPFAVIEAFRRLEWRTIRDVGLILRVNQASQDRELLGRLHEASRGSQIRILTDTLNRNGVDDLFVCADAYISLHRSEGLGLPLIESMYLRKPVIATHYGGVTDFLDESTGFPVPYRLVHLDRDYPPYPVGAVWADPDIEAASDSMLRVLDEPQEARQRSDKAFERVTALYGIEAASRRLDHEVRRICGLRAASNEMQKNAFSRASRTMDGLIEPQMR